MNLAALASLTVVTSAATSFLAVRIAEPGAAEPERAIAAPAQDADLVTLREEVARLEERLAGLVVTASPAERTPVAEPIELEELVRELVAQHVAADLEPTLEEAVPAGDLATLVKDPLAAYRAILAAGPNTEEASSIWDAAVEAGTVDDLLQLFRDEVEANPQSVQANLELAQAAHGAAMADPNHANGTWWRESDDSYGKVLELDAQYSDARYEKALRLCFWPDAFGRRPEAIRHFERLLDEGANLSGENHLDSFLWLGNLYAQSGMMDEASRTWRRGLGTYPENESLLAKLDGMEGQ